MYRRIKVVVESDLIRCFKQTIRRFSLRECVEKGLLTLVAEGSRVHLLMSFVTALRW